eukprot:gnl/TRDRNA2_/TRDRNA2_164131_c0_seq1.p1 gnl/TRDRNA2_/TRDRNA2_164131_c0~~gnl/TRDRNA2_/TRDRNA2_164131_c0_seq1.p1  ORF type:complete len:367 (+),score=65.06 gnl/TRDRNA2_/TRDRNA2_164131_c0_seq1:34-1101(+)
MFDFEEFEINPKEPAAFTEQLWEAAQSQDLGRERGLLDAVDTELEVAINAAGAEAAACKGEFKPHGKRFKLFADWFEFLCEVIIRLAELNGESLSLFDWESRGKEKCGAALIRRLWGMCSSSSFDWVNVLSCEASESRGVVLMTGKGGGSIEDMKGAADWWIKQGFSVVEAVKCGSHKVRKRQAEQMLKALVACNVASVGLLVHNFSENGFQFWGTIMSVWEEEDVDGLPPLDCVLRGIVRDSCSTHATAAFDEKGNLVDDPWAHVLAYREKSRSSAKIDSKGVAIHVILKSLLNMAQMLLPWDHPRMDSLGSLGTISKCIQHWPLHRGCHGNPAELQLEWARPARRPCFRRIRY